MRRSPSPPLTNSRARTHTHTWALKCASSVANLSTVACLSTHMETPTCITRLDTLDRFPQPHGNATGCVAVRQEVQREWFATAHEGPDHPSRQMQEPEVVLQCPLPLQ